MRITAQERTFLTRLARKGGRARALKLSAARRREIAKMGGRAFRLKKRREKKEHHA